jgi:uncharacterized membrane protein
VSSTVVLGLTVFLASCVEMVEALTIVLAVGVTRGWRSALEGVAVAVALLGVVVAALGPAVVAYVPLGVLRVVIGALLLVFGLQWLRKALLRASGFKAKHDEDAIYRREVARLRDGAGERRRRDATAFTVAFKGVFLEGTEVVVIVLTVGLAGHRLGLAVLAAAGGVVLVGVVGLVVARRLAGVPENAMKLGVGLMLASFGTFWLGEGLGVSWPGRDLFILALLAGYGAASAVLVAQLNRRRQARAGLA